MAAAASGAPPVMQNWNLTEEIAPAAFVEATSVEDVQRVCSDPTFPSPVRQPGPIVEGAATVTRSRGVPAHCQTALHASLAR
jgi:hypothetical protein